MTDAHVVSVASMEHLRGLEPLMRRIFVSSGARSPRWFERKLARECARAELSRLAHVGDDPSDASAWIGVVLVGTPSSLHPVARTLGVGVVPEHRGGGTGRRLIEATLAGLAGSAWTHIRIVADERAAGFFERLGFVTVQRQLTLLGFGTGARTVAMAPPSPWSAEDPPPVCGWLREAWCGTPATERFSLRHQRMHFDVSQEGVAWVVHRIVGAGDVASNIDALLDYAPAAKPVLVLGLDPVSSITETLLDGRWVAVQRSRQVQRRVPQIARS